MTEQSLHKSDSPIRSNESNQLNEQSFLSRLRTRLGFDNSQSLRETIADALESEKPAEENFSKQERSMLLNSLRFGALRVEDVMVPRADIIALDESSSLFTTLVIKTNCTIPYTSVFLQLDCAYWGAENEAVLRQKMSDQGN